jgi:hypothetical protein
VATVANMSAGRRLQTRFGDLGFCVDDPRAGPDAEVRIEFVPVVPNLPAGMAVRKATAALLSYRPTRTSGPSGLLHLKWWRPKVRFTCRWISPRSAEFEPEGGEALVGGSWIIGDHLVAVGTEDADSLSQRLTNCGITPHDDDPIATADGVQLVLPFVAIGETVTVHFIVVESDSSERGHLSSWYAIEMPHSAVLAQRAESARS